MGYLVKIGNKFYQSMSEASKALNIDVQRLKRTIVFKKEVNGEKAELIYKAKK